MAEIPTCETTTKKLEKEKKLKFRIWFQIAFVYNFVLIWSALKVSLRLNILDPEPLVTDKFVCMESICSFVRTPRIVGRYLGSDTKVDFLGSASEVQDVKHLCPAQ